MNIFKIVFSALHLVYGITLVVLSGNFKAIQSISDAVNNLFNNSDFQAFTIATIVFLLLSLTMFLISAYNLKRQIIDYGDFSLDIYASESIVYDIYPTVMNVLISLVVVKHIWIVVLTVLSILAVLLIMSSNNPRKYKYS